MRLFTIIAICVSAAFALPTETTLAVRASGCTDHASGDPDFVTDCATLANSVTCPNGITGKQGGVVFLVHGTGSKGAESWSQSPYNSMLTAKGYDICWVDLPQRSLADAQLSAEYVAYNIPKLAKKSATKKVSIIGHSQGGGFNPQWALLYWKNTRNYVSAYVALAGDFHGTTVPAYLACSAGKVTGCQPSIWQQTLGSKYETAQNKRGGVALVPTTSIRSVTDEVVLPEYPPTSASPYLPGATNIALQDICGPAYYQEHIGMLIDPTAFALAVDALAHGGHASASRVGTSNCANVFSEFQHANAVLGATIQGAIAVPNSPRTTSEPPLMPYVCAAGDAPASQCSS